MMTGDDSKKEILRRGLEALDAIELRLKSEELFRHVEDLDTSTREERLLARLSELVRGDLESEGKAQTAPQVSAAADAGSEISLSRRIEEFARGLISSLAGTFAEFQMQSIQAAPVTGFRRSRLQSARKSESTDVVSPDLPEVVNWVPTDISQAVVGCSVFLSWTGRGAPSARPALTVLYDEEAVSFDTKPEGARGIEISIMQETPARFMIEITESGDYVVNLYSS